MEKDKSSTHMLKAKDGKQENRIGFFKGSSCRTASWKLPGNVLKTAVATTVNSERKSTA